MYRFFIMVALLAFGAVLAPVPAAAEYRWKLPEWAPTRGAGGQSDERS